MEDRPFINRILISLVTAFSFVAMSLSGIAAFIVPQGKVAFWTNWTFLGLSKTQWGNIHITTSVLFLIAGIWHTWYNWTPLMQYLRGVPDRMAVSLRDLAVATLITVFFAVGAVTRTPPLNYILNFNNWVKESWVRTPADDPPFGHAELLSLKGFCKKMYIDTGEALLELRHAGLRVTDENSTVEQIAHMNKMTPASVYQIIKKLERPESIPPAVTIPTPALRQVVPVYNSVTRNRTATPPIIKETSESPRYTGDLVVERFEGKGIGKKSLTVICQELHLDCEKVQQKLKTRNISLKDDESIKEAASRLGMVPIEVLKIILEGELI
ncbi:DUF4405 domain-containing protein [Geobacter pelophilus]|uniref:DUF4405 domain-containing protein n=1 Tax=Geoanaerobacter pelophilus TaxID=60036 RepID=A0AAW4L9D6_9BACT|nr:DUF4405 domain-containing protein [Geoanaerobacter pelophilus]MBT0666465.1 DUF4405 domain-containing protein [Geoanaerobacter pelophilus]